MILYKGASLDRTDATNVNEFNELFRKYKNMVFPEESSENKESADKAIKNRLKSLENLDMSKIKIGSKKAPTDLMKSSGKIKII